jgi:chitodextrinase/uncharacterized Zn finger protein (UPF0148 family)
MVTFNIVMAKLRAAAVLILGLLIAGNGALPAASGTGDEASVSPREGGPRAGTVLYMNKTVGTPNIDGVWDSAAWQKGRVYDISNGMGRCVMYIMYTAVSGSSTRLFIGIEVFSDQNSADNGILEIALDGDNDGKVTYENTDPNGTEAGVVYPRPIWGGPCVDRWAQIRDAGPNEAGWMNLWCATVQLWRVSGGYESGDEMDSGFSAHRFYEYSTDYNRNMGLGEDDEFGLNLRVSDQSGSSYQLPANYSGYGGPFARFALTQGPVAVIRSPVANNFYYKGDEIEFDGSDSTDDEYSSLRYHWSFDDGAAADTRLASHGFATTGRHTATLQVTDADGHEDNATVVFHVKEKNVAPAIASRRPLLDPVVNETEAITFEVVIRDDNMNQSVGESIWVNWTLDGKRVRTGLAFPESNYTFSTSYDGPASAGVYYVNVSIQDTYDGGSPEPTVQSWMVTVQNRNRVPLFTFIEPDVDQLSIPETGSLQFRIEYLDPDGDNITAQWYADNESLPGTRNKGTVTWQPDYNSSGPHELKAVLTDRGGGVAERTWAVLVTNVDRPPAITSSAPSQSELSVKEGSELKFNVVRFDPDMEPLATQWYVDTTPIPDSNSSSFTFNASFEGPFSSEGSPYTVKVVVRDPFGLSAERSWELAVEEVNRLPVAQIDAPADGSNFGLGETVRVRGDRSYDLDSADNGSLQYTWDFGDGKTGSGPSGSHKYDKTGPYTIRLTVRDRTSASSAFVHINIQAAVLWVTDILVSPAGIREDRPVNITVRLSNTGDADARDVRVKLLVDNIPVATLSLPVLAAQERDEVMFTWTAVKGDHTLRAVIEPTSSVVIPPGSESEKTVTVKARPPPADAGTPGWLAGAAGAFVAVLALSAVAWVVMSRRRKARGPAPVRTAGGTLTPEAALAALTTAPPPAPPAPAPAPAATGPAGEAEPAAPAPDAGAGAAQEPPEAEPPRAPAVPEAPSTDGAAPPPATPAAKQAADEAASAAEATQAVREAPPPAPMIPPAGPAAAPAGSACPSCGEALEPGWKVCPACGAKLGEAAVAPAPEAEAPAAAAPADFAERVAAVRKRIVVLTAMDKDVSALQSTLDLAASFNRTGKTEKAGKYLEKAEEMLAELDVY